MKWLFTFAVLGRPLKDRLTQACASVIEGALTVGDLEALVAGAVRDYSGEVAFYRSVMEAWSAAHRELAFWVIATNPALFTPWRQFVTYGVFCVAGGSRELRRLVRPRPRELRLAARALSDTVSSAEAFLDALFGAIEAAKATDGTIVITGRILGPGAPQASGVARRAKRR